MEDVSSTGTCGSGGTSVWHSIADTPVIFHPMGRAGPMEGAEVMGWGRSERRVCGVRSGVEGVDDDGTSPWDTGGHETM